MGRAALCGPGTEEDHRLRLRADRVPVPYGIFPFDSSGTKEEQCTRSICRGTFMRSFAVFPSRVSKSRDEILWSYGRRLSPPSIGAGTPVRRWNFAILNF